MGETDRTIVAGNKKKGEKKTAKDRERSKGSLGSIRKGKGGF